MWREECVKPGDRERGVEREAKISVHINGEVKRERGDCSHTGTKKNRKARKRTGTKDRPGGALFAGKAPWKETALILVCRRHGRKERRRAS